ncbi:MAG: dihydrodipicolinate synthase family protein [Microbacteriaceae bacterium]|nr:MAG: dihydrodipicolinate synthase family protein [Microbacteriaceae bacterium]
MKGQTLHGIIRGVIPVAPTVFLENEELDLHGQRRIVDYLIDGESDAVCVLANYSEQFSLDDVERGKVIDATLDQTDGRIPVVVTTSHYSARVAAIRSKDAQERGASMVMLMPPFLGTSMRVDDAGVIEFFKRVADGLDIDIMIQDSPLSTTLLSVDVIARIAEAVPQVRYAKIEMPRTAAKVRALHEAVSDNLPGVYDGEEAVTLIHDLDAGVKGTMSSCLVPDELGAIVRAYHSGSREKATRQWEALLPLIHYENRQCGLAAAKLVLKEGGVIASDRVRAPLSELSGPTRRELLDLARRFDILALRWS